MRDLDLVVHDVRGALTVISGQCHTLGRRKDPHLAATLRLIEREVDRVGRALDRVVGEPSPDRGLVDVGRLAREVAEANLAHAGRCRRRIAIFVEEGLMITGRPGRVRVAIENLVHNALRHAPAETTVIVRAVRDSSGILVEVVDEGPGVPPGDRARIFRAGQRGTRPIGRGSGLGLAIARGIAQEHGGSLELVEPSAGATFRLTFPGGR